MGFKERLRNDLKRRKEGTLPEISYSPVVFKQILTLLDAVDEITMTPTCNNYDAYTETYIVDGEDMAILVKARNELGGGDE